MNTTISLFKTLDNSIKSKVFDYELFNKLNDSIKTLQVIQQTVKEYIQLMINVYELSNIQTLFSISKNTINAVDLAFDLKLLTCEMISQIILYYDKQTQSAYQFPLNVLVEALQIMITTVRICLNQGNKYVIKILQFYRLINGPFQYAYENISHQTKFIHYLNVLQIKKYKTESEKFQIIEFQNRIRHLYGFKQMQSVKYKEYVQYLIMETLIKAIKSGHLNSQQIGNFEQYLSKQYFFMLKNSFQFTQQQFLNSTQVQGSQFFQLYLQIKNQGVQNISLEYLQEIIKKPDNFTNPSIFDIAALTLEPVVLQIWFHVHNSLKQNVQILGQAYKCFIYLVDKINTIKFQGQNQVKKSLKQETFLRLSKNIALSLLTEKRQGKIKNSDPVFQIIKSLINLLIWLVFNLCKNFQKIKDFCQKLVLLCVKFSCPEVCKTIYSIQMYFELLYNLSSKQTFQNFIKSYQNQSTSQIYRVLKSAYEFQNTSQDQQKKLDTTIFKSRPFLLILFGNQWSYLSILNLDIREFVQIKSKFSIYFQIVRKLKKEQKHLLTVLNHIQQTMIQLSLIQTYKQFFFNVQDQRYAQKEVRNIQLLRSQLAQLQQKTQLFQDNNLSYKLSFVSLLLCFLQKQYLQLCQKINFGVVLNKFSKFIKIIYAICDHLEVCSQRLFIYAKIYLAQTLQIFKKQTLKREKLGQVGQVAFVQSVSMLLKKYYTKTEHAIDKKQLDFLLFTIFQLDCLTNNTEQYQQKYYQFSLNMLRIFSQSAYIPGKLKQKCLRRLLKQNILTRQCEITLKDFKDLIQMSQNEEERSLYIKHVISIHGENGKNMLYLLANTNKSIQNQLSKSNL